MNGIKKLIMVLAPTIMLSGCVWQDVTIKEVEAGIHFCKGKGGVGTYREYFAGRNEVLCANGERVATNKYYQDNYKEFTND